MNKFLEKIRGLEEKKRKNAVLIMSAITMILVILIWIAYMRAVVSPIDRVENNQENIETSLAHAVASAPQNVILWIENFMHHLLEQRKTIIER